MKRRNGVWAVAGLVAAGILVVGAVPALWPGSSPADAGGAVAGAAEMVVYKSPTCGCCNGWVEHMRAAGFAVRAENVSDMHAVKVREGIPLELSSCHTSVLGGYVFEGHIPAPVIQRFLDEAPDLVGLTVPGMPIGSPGMEGPNPVPYEVIALGRDGSRTVYETVRP